MLIRKRMALIFGFAALMLGAVSAVIFAGISDDDDYPRAWDMTTAEHLSLSSDVGDRDYVPNHAPSHTILLLPHVDTGESAVQVTEAEESNGVFSSVSRGNNQFDKIKKARKANAPKTCHPFDRGCLQRLACQGAAPTSTVSKAHCMPGDLICVLRLVCG